MSEYQDQFYELLEQTYGTASIAKLHLCEQAVRLADAHQDIELGVEGRLQMIELGVFSGCTDRVLPAMGWVLAKTDDDPELYDAAHPHVLMWSYKWIASNLTDFPTIPLEKIDEVLQDLSRRYDDFGYDERAVCSARVRSYLGLGFAGKLRPAFERWNELPRGEMSDCHACEINVAVQCHLLWDDIDEAVLVAEPLLNGKLSCAEVPYATYCHLMLPLFDSGRVELAQDLQRRAQKQIQKVPGDRGKVGDQMALLALTGEANRAVRLLDNNLTPLLAMTEVEQHERFFTGAAVLMHALLKAGEQAITLRDHRDFPVASGEDRKYDVQELATWFTDRTRQIAEQYDQRAGNSFRLDRLKQNLARVGVALD